MDDILKQLMKKQKEEQMRQQAIMNSNTKQLGSLDKEGSDAAFAFNFLKGNNQPPEDPVVYQEGAQEFQQGFMDKIPGFQKLRKALGK